MKFWHPNSPDFNPIENLWGAIKRILKRQTFNSKSERNMDEFSTR